MTVEDTQNPSVIEHSRIPPRVFSYHRYALLPGFAGILLSLSAWALGITCALDWENTDDLWGAIFCIGFALSIDAIVIFVALLKSRVIVDEVGISRVLLGWTWRSIPWKRIRRIRITSFLDIVRYPKAGTIILYILDQTEKPAYLISKHGNIKFDDTIENLPELLEIINTKIREHNIETIDDRTTPPIRCAHL